MMFVARYDDLTVRAEAEDRDDARRKFIAWAKRERGRDVGRVWVLPAAWLKPHQLEGLEVIS
jgi:hypothetical protein